MSSQTKELQTGLTQFKHRIIAAYLFGSTARGEAGPLSDIDFAVVYHSKDNDLEISVYRLVTKVFGTDKIDFINLHEAPLSLQYQVIKEGQKIYVGDETGRIDFETAVIMHYLDFQPLRQEFFAEYRKTL